MKKSKVPKSFGPAYAHERDRNLILALAHLEGAVEYEQNNPDKLCKLSKRDTKTILKITRQLQKYIFVRGI